MIVIQPAQLTLVTGAAGRIGRAVVAELDRRKHRVRGFDRVASPGVADMILGDVSDRPAVDRAMVGVHTLIHLAATPDDADFLKEMILHGLIDREVMKSRINLLGPGVGEGADIEARWLRLEKQVSG